MLYCSATAVLALDTDPAAERLQIIERPLEQNLVFNLSGDDWRWLGKKRMLRLGTVAPDHPPFDFSDSHQDFDGLTADYVALLAKQMGLIVEVVRYPTREAANMALAKGNIDILGNTIQSELAGQDFVLSRPYAVNRTAIVLPIGKHNIASKPGAALRMAVVPGYLSEQELHNLYPLATFKPYPDVRRAILGVLHNEADIFLGDAIGASFLIHKGYFSVLRTDGFAPVSNRDVGFAVQKQNTVLLRVLDTLLKAIPESVHRSMLQRWGVGLDFRITATPLVLTDAERKWIAQHPKVRVAVNGLFAPLTFYTQSGQFDGLVSDYLRLIELRTGLDFEVVRIDSIPDMINAVREGKAHMVGALLMSPERQADLAFAQPFLLNNLVLVARSDDTAITDLAQMNGKKLAIQGGNPMVPQLRKQYPGIELVLVDQAISAFEKLAQGQVDGTIQTQIATSYFIEGPFRGKLRIAAPVGEDMARLAMGVRRSEPELRDILNKVLRSIPPNDAIMLTNRWREKNDAEPSSWNTYRWEIYQIAAGALLLILASLFWIAYLRRQIAKRKLAERALGDQLAFMRAMIDDTPHPIYVRDLNARLIECNRSYLEAMGGERDQVIGKLLPESTVFPPETAQEFHAMYLQTMQDGIPVFADRDMAFGERHLRIYHWTLPFKDTRGKPAGLIGGWIDISEREQLIDALQLAKEEADEASRAKSTFLATMSHEIRTPMNAIIGMLELVLKRGENGLWDRPSIKVAYDSAKTLLGLIGDILDIAKIESGKLELVPERANLRELVEAVARVFDGLARQKGLTLRTFIDANAGVEVLVDPMRFKQILSNLVSNAIKFTQEGEVTIRLDVQEEKDGRLALQLQVSDTGSGIPQEEQAKLFAPFVQASATRPRSAESGTGLGLAISRRLAQMMGGDIALQSELGVGTQILVRFTVATVEPLGTQQQPATVVAPKLGRLRVLVADDNVANRLVLCQQLQYLGHDVESAEDGREALQIWRAGSFDLVMTDCNMPVMSGYQLAREIRNEADTRHCVIWGYTANAQPEEIQRCKAAGMDDCLFKPIGLDDLQRRLTVGLPHNIVDAKPKPADSLFDASSLEAMTGGNFALVSRLAKELINSNRNDSLLLIQRVTAADWLAAGDVAHSIKGASTIVGAQVLSEAAAELESLCRDGAADGDLRQAASVVLAEITHLEQSLESWLLEEAGET
ncbi:virulence sensor protein BvgS [Collimonas fungivorans]|uniref:Virulence sensor protein BvgS n=1 Tax=Collimonas fungivorans TaxID=158899 RepID=A0A127PHD9_9BURK|nr:transporter substrate-binding domain-containing protein [Collimonas fungivorans]AMO97135.1 virulence sensor protein BvgS [Collimonas fungivorans]